MPKVILCGRGGSGKSTLACLLSSVLRKQGEVLVVDIDESNLGLGKMLGVETPEKSLMDYLGGKPTVQKKLIASFTQGGEKTRLIDEKLTFQALPAECVTWNNSLGFLRVGKIEHTMEGCACPMGAISRAFLKQLEVASDQWVLIDTEAGVEHFGRGVVEGADAVIAVIDPSHDAVLLAMRIKELAVEAGKRFLAVLNKVDEDSEPILREELQKRGIEVSGAITFSPEMNRANLLGRQLPADSLSLNIQRLLERLL